MTAGSSLELKIPPSQPIDVARLTMLIRQLIEIESDDAPIVSCYYAPNEPGAREFFTRRHDEVTSVLPPARHAVTLEAFSLIRRYLEHELDASMAGVAVFARTGDRPVFVAMQFRVAFQLQIGVGRVPNIYRLVELKDTYDRYVVFITSERSSRIVEVDLGAVTRELWTKRPELRGRVADAWSHDHYQRHRSHALEEELAILERLVAAGRHAHLMLAGPASRVAFVRSQLPPTLRQRLIDVPGAVGDDVVVETLGRFIDSEQQESRATADELITALERSGLAVAGTVRTLDALYGGRADVLVLAKSYPKRSVAQCGKCGWIDTLLPVAERCSACNATQRMFVVERGEALVRLAEQRGVDIELVDDCEELTNIGGVGCLLRYSIGFDDLLGSPL